MAGHSKYKNIKHRKDAQDKIRARKFTKLGMDITAAARRDTNPDSNASLRHAINQAKHHNMPKQNIQAAINKAKISEASDRIVTMEAKGESGIFVIMETTEEWKPKIIHDIRKILSKHNWKLVDSGAAMFNFEKKGVFSYLMRDLKQAHISEDLIYEVAIEHMADEVEIGNEECFITCPIEYFSNLRLGLQEAFGPLHEADTQFISHNRIKLDTARSEKYNSMYDLIDNIPEILSIYSNIELNGV